MSVVTAALIAGATLPVGATPTPPIKDDGLTSTGPGGDGGGSLGPAKPWLGSLGSINTGTGNLFTAIPLFGWNAKGGLPVGFSFFHNSIAPKTPSVMPTPFARQWSFSYNSYLVVGPDAISLYEEDGGISTFARNIDGTWKTPLGTYLRMENTPTSGGGSYILKTKSGTRLRFTDIQGPRYYLNSVQDRNGYTVNIARNPNNRYQVTQVTDPTGRALIVTWGGWSNSQIVKVTAPNGKEWRMSYDDLSLKLGNITWPTIAPSTSNISYYIRFGYSGDKLAGLSDLRGNTTSFWYSDSTEPGAVTYLKNASDNQVTILYEPDKTTITDFNGRITRHYYDGRHLTRNEDPNGKSILLANFDSNNNAWLVTDRKGNPTQFTFDSSGNVLSVTDAENKTSLFTYEGDSDLKTATNALNQTTTYNYTNGNLTSIVDPLNHTTTFTVVQGLVTEIIDPLNHKTTIGYNANGYPNFTRDANNLESAAEYSVMGTLVNQWDAAGRKTAFELDAWERVIGVSKAGDAQTPGPSVALGLDANGNTTSVRRDNGAGYGVSTSTFWYDSSNRLFKAINGRGDVSEWGYDGAGQKGLLSWSQNGNGAPSRRTYLYNERDLPYRITHSDGDTEEWAYDNNGNTTAYKNGDNFVNQYAYDKRNLLTDVLHPQGYGSPISTPFHFERDALGRTVWMTDATGRTDVTYDDAGRATALTSPRGTLTYAYDAADRLYLKTLSGVGAWQYFHDDGNRVVGMITPFNEPFTFHFDTVGRMDYQISGNNVSTGYRYDVRDQLREIQHYQGGNPVAFSRFQYDYDGAGRVTNAYQDGLRTQYTYDGADQLIREWRGNPDGSQFRYDVGYTYDGNGNRKTKTANGTVVESSLYGPGDRLQSVDGSFGRRTYAYNARGFLTQTRLNGVVEATLTPDQEDRLLSLVFPNGDTTTFGYNALGQRVFKQDNSGPYNYVTDGASAGSPVLSDGRAIYTPGLSERRGGVSRFHHTDLLGSLGVMMDAAQNGTDTRTFDAWGLLTSQWGSTPTPFAWGGAGGYQKDASTGLVLMGHRYYDASIGRFLSRDPARSGSNWYAYADNNPVTNLDPLGLRPDPPPSTGGPQGYYQATSGSGYLQKWLLTGELWPSDDALAAAEKQAAASASNWLGHFGRRNRNAWGYVKAGAFFGTWPYWSITKVKPLTNAREESSLVHELSLPRSKGGMFPNRLFKNPTINKYFREGILKRLAKEVKYDIKFRGLFGRGVAIAKAGALGALLVEDVLAWQATGDTLRDPLEEDE